MRLCGFTGWRALVFGAAIFFLGFWIVFQLCACTNGDDIRPDAPLPTCKELGCPTTGFCRSHEICQCIPPGETEPLACSPEPAP